MSSPSRIRLQLLAVASLSIAAGVVAVVGARAAQRAVVSEAPPVEQRSAMRAATETLAFRAVLDVKYPPEACPAGAPNSFECFTRAGRGIIRGLGSVEESYAYVVENLPGGCDPNPVRVLPGTARLSVPGKGEITIRVSGTGCLSRVPPNPLLAEETFTITAGTGRYAGASGGGTIAHISNGPPAWTGEDTWTGTLLIPGLSFDLTAPTLTGARNTRIRVPTRVKRVRVRYAVTGRDDVDGKLAVSCRPRSGSWFTVGRKLVRCSAMDRSGNESTATFVVTVKHKH
jgi:HYR domain